MGTTVFPFTVRGREPDERYFPIESVSNPEGDGGTLYRRLRAKRFGIRNAELIFPDTVASKSFADWDTFWETTLSGGIDSFLYAARRPIYRIVSGEAAGTASGGGGETFTTVRKFIHHTDFGESATTLVVKVDGVAQTLTTDYTVSGNGTAPTITTTASFDTGAVTFDYEFYFQVFGYLLRTADLVPGASLSSPGTDRVVLDMIEQASGGSLA